MKLAKHWVPSPNHGPRVVPPDMILLHYTGMTTGAEALARLCDPTAEVSAHYLIEEDGCLLSLVPEARRAWHAGVSYWAGERDINGRSIGIEIVNPGHEFGYQPFPEVQIATVIALIGDIRERWQIEDSRILGHSDVAPARKTDPGEWFPWSQLAQAGHGLWVEPDPAPGEPLTLGAEGIGVLALQAGLSRLGFDLARTGAFDQHTALVVQAFQRHWVQRRFDGVADGDTRARLMALLRLAG